MVKFGKRFAAAVLAAAFAMTSSFQGNVSVQGAETPAAEIPEGYTAVADIADLYGINNDLSGKYILVNDIDLSETAPGGSWDAGHGWTPIGADADKGFSGVLDGNGHFVKNMHIYGDAGNDIGLFSLITGGGKVTNLGVADCDISVKQERAARIGGIAGKIVNGEISNCFVSGKIEDLTEEVSDSLYYSYVGGISGGSYDGLIENCYNAANIQAEVNNREQYPVYIGGIIGSGSYADCKCCYNIGSVRVLSEQLAGGIAGLYSDIRTDRCYYLNSSVTGDNENSCGTALTDAQMKTPKAYTGFDFENTWYIDDLSDCSYPQLRSCPQMRITECKLTVLPDKLEYSAGDELDLSGGVLSVGYENGITSTIALEEVTVSGYDADKTGKQTLQVSYANGTASFEITVKEVLAESLQLNYEEYELNRGETVELTADFTPLNVTDQTLTWETDNELVAAVDAEGGVKGINAGTAVITVSTANGVQAACTVTVKVPAKKLKLSATKLTLKKGKQKKVKAAMTPLDATDSITWTSSNAKIASVSSKGVITAKKKGSAVVMAKTDSGISKKIKVTVK